MGANLSGREPWLVYKPCWFLEYREGVGRGADEDGNRLLLKHSLPGRY